MPGWITVTGSFPRPGAALLGFHPAHVMTLGNFRAGTQNTAVRTVTFKRDVNHKPQ